MYHLHCVGRAYYTRRRFKVEAERYGVSRRISLKDLKAMEWGDTVLLAIQEGKSLVIFGEFTVDRLSGLSPEANRAIAANWPVEKVSDGGAVVRRGCGSYVEGATYTFTEPVSLREIALFLEQLKKDGVDIGLPMISGPFYSRRSVRLLDVPFRQGFRAFNYDCFMAAVEAAKANGAKYLAVHGQFYVGKEARTETPATGCLQEVHNYRRKEQEAASGA